MLKCMLALEKFTTGFTAILQLEAISVSGNEGERASEMIDSGCYYESSWKKFHDKANLTLLKTFRASKFLILTLHAAAPSKLIKPTRSERLDNGKNERLRNLCEIFQIEPKIREY